MLYESQGLFQEAKTNYEAVSGRGGGGGGALSAAIKAHTDTVLGQA